MLINLSNHPAEGWAKEQFREACDRWRGVADMPFPNIAPSWSGEEVRALAEEYFSECRQVLATAEGPSAVHLMGEQVFCFHLTTLLREAGVTVVASTTERNVSYNPSTGMKEVYFSFIRFREF